MAPVEVGRTVSPWMVRPSHAVVFVGMTPFGAEHSTMSLALVASVPAKTWLAGTTTLMVWPLSNGWPAAKGATG
jgi:hypothetical protein